MSGDPYVRLREGAIRSVLEGDGVTPPALRSAAAAAEGLPAEFESLVRKIHDRPYAVTDDDIGSLRPRHGDDVLFEIVVSAALGAAEKRLAAGLRALEDA